LVVKVEKQNSLAIKEVKLAPAQAWFEDMAEMGCKGGQYRDNG